MVKTLEIIYEKADLKQLVNNATQINFEERTQLGDLTTKPVDLKLKPGSKPF